MKKFIIPAFFTLLLSLIFIYILYPLNYGAVALVFVLSAGVVWIAQAVFRSLNKKPGNDK